MSSSPADAAAGGGGDDDGDGEYREPTRSDAKWGTGAPRRCSRCAAAWPSTARQTGAPSRRTARWPGAGLPVPGALAQEWAGVTKALALQRAREQEDARRWRDEERAQLGRLLHGRGWALDHVGSWQQVY